MEAARCVVSGTGTRGLAIGRAMSISDPKVKTGKRRLKTRDPTTVNAVVDESNLATPPPPPVPHDRDDTRAATPSRTIADRDLTLIQISCDFVCACIALPLSLLVLSRLSSASANESGQLLANLRLDSVFPIAVVVALALGGAYRVAHRRLQPSAFLELRELSFGVGCGCVLALAIGSFLHGAFGTPEPYVTQLVMAVIVATGVITVGRVVLRFYLRTLTTTRVLVVGSGLTADRIMLSVRQEPAMTLVGRAVEGDTVDAGAIGRVSDLPELCRQLDVHRILVAANEQFSAESLDVYRRLQDSVHIAMVPRYFELISWRSRLTDLFGTPLLEIAQPHISAWDRFMKRAFDLCMSSAVLVAMSPLLVVVAIGVKLSSPGPVFFRQVRLGRSAEPFRLIKFRSMTTGTEAAPAADAVPERDDPGLPLHQLRNKNEESGRITDFGAFLRRTGIDEIPQFINVFKGDMSIVGPRPFIPSQSNVEGWATRRFEVRPGITGLWQVSGRNDLTRNDLVQLDYLYVASWSLWWDLKIMFETPMTMVRGTGAY
jgi:exopolysaccharide biosynthesis polyprenyl glycosylphosphotransferase